MPTDPGPECISCESLSAMRPLSGHPYAYIGEHFVVDHAVPVARPGWFVIVLRRHAEQLHDLTEAEWAELGELMPKVVRAVHEVTGCEKEYVMQFSEAPGFRHLHWHIVGRLESETLRGAAIFDLLKTDNPMPAADLAPICATVRELLAR